MTTDWATPDRDFDSLPSEAALIPWHIDHDPRDNEDGVRIYAFGGPEVPLRCVAKEVDPEDAALIVKLYDEWRTQ